MPQAKQKTQRELLYGLTKSWKIFTNIDGKQAVTTHAETAWMYTDVYSAQNAERQLKNIIIKP
jgi:hypothetical protein